MQVSIILDKVSGVSIKRTILFAFLATAVLIGLLGGLVFFRVIRQAEEIATSEATSIARTISLFIAHELDEAGANAPYRSFEIQQIVLNFKRIQNRDFVIVGMDKRIVANAQIAKIGMYFSCDPGDEVGQTLRDGRARTFTEIVRPYREGVKYAVVPLESHPGKRVGAIILEYTPLYENILNRARNTAAKILLLYLGALAASLTIGQLITRHISGPLRKLQHAALQIAAGNLEAKVTHGHDDEFGSLAESFNIMVDDLKSTRDKLLQSNKELTEMNSRLHTLIHAMPDMVFFKDLDGRYLLVNKEIEKQAGMRWHDIIGKTADKVMPPELAAYCKKSDEETIRAGHRLQFEERRIDVAGGEKILETVKAPIFDAGGSLMGLVGVSRDITSRKKMENTIKYQAHYDFLTGLPNRNLFLDHLNLSLARAHNDRQTLAVMFLDLDRFKTINDTLGHATGDLLLRGIAERMRACVRESDIIARFGGDEFAILLPHITHAADACSIAEKILTVFKAPFPIDGHELHVTPSVGISIFPDDGEYGETLLKNADIAMYHAKEQGRDNYQFYNPAMNIRTLEQMILENSLRQTLQRGELVVYYQPQVCIRTGDIRCVEALVRWQHPELGLLDPLQFIPLAEEIGCIIPIGEWVLRTACLQNRAWHESGLPDLCVTVNLSIRQLQQQDFIGVVAGILHETGLDAGFLEFEITENTAMQNLELIISNLQHLASMGVRISIDDFGTGYSSLNYLKKLPVQKLKIDKSFTSGLTNDSDYKAIVTAIIAMAHSLKLTVVAEGVETEDQLELLRSAECDGVQGFIFSEPLPPERFREMIAVYR